MRGYLNNKSIKLGINKNTRSIRARKNVNSLIYNKTTVPQIVHYYYSGKQKVSNEEILNGILNNKHYFAIDGDYFIYEWKKNFIYEWKKKNFIYEWKRISFMNERTFISFMNENVCLTLCLVAARCE